MVNIKDKKPEIIIFILLINCFINSFGIVDYNTKDIESTDNMEFTISIDEDLQQKWGFRYPVTYIFNIYNTSPGTAVFYRHNNNDAWLELEKKSINEIFNGVNCVRFDNANNKVYASVGFEESNKIYLKFSNASNISFEQVAKYYDNRKAAYSLSNDNWARRTSANPGAEWQGMTNDASDKYQASIHAARLYNIPFTIGINSIGKEIIEPNPPEMWERMQEELNYSDYSWEPGCHSRTHPYSVSAYTVFGYWWEIIGCRNDILTKLSNIPYGQYVFEFMLPAGYQNDSVLNTAANEFLFVRGWNGNHNPTSTTYAPWNDRFNFYGIGGYETFSYDKVLEGRGTKGRYYESDVRQMNNAFDQVYNDNGIFYAFYHADRYENSVLFDTLPGINGKQGSSLMKHFEYLANRPDVWYVANGWLYSYHAVAENVSVIESSELNIASIPYETLSLKQNYPNPFNSSTRIFYTIPNYCNVRINVYNINGILVHSLIDKKQNSGSYSVIYNSENIDTGLYFYELQINGMPVIKKKMLKL